MGVPPISEPAAGGPVGGWIWRYAALISTFARRAPAPLSSILRYCKDVRSGSMPSLTLALRGEDRSVMSRHLPTQHAVKHLQLVLRLVQLLSLTTLVTYPPLVFSRKLWELDTI